MMLMMNWLMMGWCWIDDQLMINWWWIYDDDDDATSQAVATRKSFFSGCSVSSLLRSSPAAWWWWWWLWGRGLKGWSSLTNFMKIMIDGEFHDYNLQVQGFSKNSYFSDFRLIAVLEVRFYFFTCDLESEFWACFIYPPRTYPFRIFSALKILKMLARTWFLSYPALNYAFLVQTWQNSCLLRLCFCVFRANDFLNGHVLGG